MRNRGEYEHSLFERQGVGRRRSKNVGNDEQDRRSCLSMTKKRDLRQNWSEIMR